MFEIEGVPEDLAREAFALAAAKLPMATLFVDKDGDVMKAIRIKRKINRTELKRELS